MSSWRENNTVQEKGGSETPRAYYVRVARLLLISWAKTSTGRKGIMDFSNDKSMLHRMDRDQKTVTRAAARAQGNGERTKMQARIRIIKRGAGANTNSLPANQSDKVDCQRERETANTVKSWVAEWEARNRLVKAAAFSLLRSLENGSASPTRRFAVVKS